MSAIKDAWNSARYGGGQTGGHYESYFQRANHPREPLAFWIRYTIFSPVSHPESAVGELWAIYFDGIRHRITAAKSQVPIAQCSFSRDRLDVKVAESTLDCRHLQGVAEAATTISWDLTYTGDEPPLFLLPESFYERRLPSAKALTGTPQAVFTGTMKVGDEPVEVDGWVGSQNHNWGSRHTDEYAWGQVAGFEGRPDAFLECSTARLRLGPVWTPRMSLVVLRVGGRELVANGLWQALRARADLESFNWRLTTGSRRQRISIEMKAPASDFVGLTYDNPPGGAKTCLNTKIAACSVTVHEHEREVLRMATTHRAAFEILTDDPPPSVPVVA